MEMDSMPAELDEMERRRMQLEIEREALRKEKDAASKRRLETLEKELADLRDITDVMKAQWEQEKEVVAGIRETREALERLQPGDRGGRTRGRLCQGRGAQVRARDGAAEAAARSGKSACAS